MSQQINGQSITINQNSVGLASLLASVGTHPSLTCLDIRFNHLSCLELADPITSMIDAALENPSCRLQSLGLPAECHMSRGQAQSRSQAAAAERLGQALGKFLRSDHPCDLTGRPQLMLTDATIFYDKSSPPIAAFTGSKHHLTLIDSLSGSGNLVKMTIYMQTSATYLQTLDLRCTHIFESGLRTIVRILMDTELYKAPVKRLLLGAAAITNVWTDKLKSSTRRNSKFYNRERYSVAAVFHLAIALRTHPTIEELDLSYNCLGVTGAAAAAVILRSGNLKLLDLSHNELSGARSHPCSVQSDQHACCGIPISGLGQPSPLEVETASSSFNFEGLAAMSDKLTSNTVLRTLDLSGNRLDDSESTGSRMLAKALLHNRTLQTLLLTDSASAGCQRHGWEQETPIAERGIPVQQLRCWRSKIDLQGRNLSVSDGLFIAHYLELLWEEKQPTKEMVINLSDNRLRGVEFWRSYCFWHDRRLLSKEFVFLSALFDVEQMEPHNLISEFCFEDPGDAIARIESWLIHGGGTEPQCYSAYCLLHAMATMVEMPTIVSPPPELCLQSNSFRQDVFHLIDLIAPERCGSYSAKAEVALRRVTTLTKRQVKFVLDLKPPIIPEVCLFRYVQANRLETA